MSAAEFEIKINEKEGIAYIPKKLRDQYGLRPIILPNDVAAAMYHAEAKPAEVVRSLKVLIKHFELRIERKTPE